MAIYGNLLLEASNEFTKQFKFNNGFEKNDKITYNGKSYSITISLDAYKKEDGISKQQEKQYNLFINKKESIISNIEKKVNTLDNSKNYKPTLLKIQKDGKMGLVFNDKSDTESGLVVLIPSYKFLDVDQFL